MYNLDLLLQECIDDLNSLGIQAGNIVRISVNTRLTSTWGKCCRRGNEYTIEINKILVNDTVTSKQAVMNTVMHEVIHTVKGCMNHGDNFKGVASIVNNYYGYNIKRCTSAAEKGLQDIKQGTQVHYKITCQSCGGVSQYCRETKVVKYIAAGNKFDRYTCRNCGGNRFTVENV